MQLKDKAQFCQPQRASVVVQNGGVLPLQPHLTARRPVQQTEQIEQRRLSGPDGPVIATNSPRRISSLASLTSVAGTSPSSVRVRCSTSRDVGPPPFRSLCPRRIRRASPARPYAPAQPGEDRGGHREPAASAKCRQPQSIGTDRVGAAGEFEADLNQLHISAAPSAGRALRHPEHHALTGKCCGYRARESPSI